jgi:hypothetical protein
MVYIVPWFPATLLQIITLRTPVIIYPKKDVNIVTYVDFSQMKLNYTPVVKNLIILKILRTAAVFFKQFFGSICWKDNLISSLKTITFKTMLLWLALFVISVVKGVFWGIAG